MSKPPCSQLVTGTVNDHETGETFESAVMMTHVTMEAVIKVQCVHSQSHSNFPMQLFIECLALDSVGEVFALDIHFPFLSHEEHEQMLASFTVGYLWKVKGMFAVAHDDGQTAITLVSPEFYGLAPENITDIESAFRINAKSTNIDADD